MKTFIFSLLSLSLFSTGHALETLPDQAVTEPKVRCLFQLGRLDPDAFEMMPTNGRAEEITLKQDSSSTSEPVWKGEALLASAKSDAHNYNYSAKVIVSYRKSASLWKEGLGRIDALVLLIDSQSGKALAATRSYSDLISNPRILETSLKKGTLKAISTTWNPEAIPSNTSSPSIEETQGDLASSGKLDKNMAMRLDSVCELKE
jgi:hypothetical protein